MINLFQAAKQKSNESGDKGFISPLRFKSYDNYCGEENKQLLQ